MARFAMRRPVLRHRSMQFEHIRQLFAHILLLKQEKDDMISLRTKASLD